MSTKSKNTDRMPSLSDLAEGLMPNFAKAQTKFGLGYKKDVEDHRDFPARKLFGARRILPFEAMGLYPHIEVFNQLDTSSCVGNASAGAIDTRMRFIKRVTPTTSRSAIYKFARSLERLSPEMKLSDEGCYPRMAMKGIKLYGVPSDKVCPFDPNTINDELTWDVLSEASSLRLTAFWRIGSQGKEMIADICQSISEGYPVFFGVDVDQRFMDFDGKYVFGPFDSKNLLGGHAMYAAAYRTNSNFQREILIVNSWGMSWGVGGMAWVSESFFLGASDLYVIQVG